MLVRLTGLLLLAIAGAACSAPQIEGRQQRPAVRISTDSIGTLPLSASVADLRRKWPAARDTVYSEHEAVFPALVFSFGDLDALAVQGRMDEETFEPLPLNPVCPATFWVVVGESAILPQGVPMTTPWGQLTKHYGPARASTELHTLRVSFERLPGWVFQLVHDDLDTVRTHGVAAIPDSARIWRVLLPQLHTLKECA